MPAPATDISVVALPPVANAVLMSVFGFAVGVTMLSLVNTGALGSGALVVPLFMVIGFLAIGIGGLYKLAHAYPVRSAGAAEGARLATPQSAPGEAWAAHQWSTEL